MTKALLLASIAGCLAGCSYPSRSNPCDWNSYHHKSKASCIPNFSKVSDGLYRGGEPTAEGWAYLQSLGVCKALRLDYESEKPEGVAVPSGVMDVDGAIPPEDLGDLFKVPKQHDLVLRATWIDANVHRYRPDPLLSGLADKTEPQVGLYLGALTGPPCPVFVHCLHGRDRTGIVIAYYRVLFCGWTKCEAEVEMLSNGFRKVNVGLWEAWEEFDPKAGDPLWK